MTHAVATVFVPEGRTLEEMMAPFNENIDVDPYEEKCWRMGIEHIEHDDECYECHGSGVYTTTRNPLSKWDWYLRADHERSRYQNFTLGEPSYAMVLPDEGWVARGDLGWWGTSTNINPDWDDLFRTAYERYSTIEGVEVVLVDYHI